MTITAATPETRSIIEKSKARTHITIKSFGKQLRDQRNKMGLSKTAVARKAGLSWSSYNRLERGDVMSTLLQMNKAATALGLELFVDLEEE